MDILQDWAFYLYRNLPTYYQNLNSFTSTFQEYGTLLFNRLVQSPDLATVALTCFILFISLKIFGMLYRAVMFWVTLAFKVVVWGGLAAIGFWIWNRGPEGVMEDVHMLMDYARAEGNQLREQAQSAKKTYDKHGRAGKSKRWR